MVKQVLTWRNEQVTGTLKGYDALMNLVLDEVQEAVRGTFVCGLACWGLAKGGLT